MRKIATARHLTYSTQCRLPPLNPEIGASKHVVLSQAAYLRDLSKTVVGGKYAYAEICNPGRCSLGVPFNFPTFEGLYHNNSKITVVCPPPPSRKLTHA